MSDIFYVPSSFMIFFLEDLQEMVGKLVFDLPLGFNLAAIHLSKFLDSRVAPILEHQVMEELGVLFTILQPFDLGFLFLVYAFLPLSFLQLAP